MTSSLLRTASFTAKRMRKCAICRSLFAPRSMTHKACGEGCAKALAEKNRLAEDRRIRLARFAALKTRSDYIRILKTHLHALVRFRDRDQPCISCGCPLTSGGIGGGCDAGHYRSVGSAKHMEFVENNIHGQCKRCNNQLAGNAVEYRRGLIARYGVEYVEALEADNTVRKLTIPELIERTAKAKADLKELQQ